MIHLLCIQDSERRCRKEERSGARFEQRRSTREMTRWRERERESVRPGTNVFAFHNKLPTPTSSNPAQPNSTAGWYRYAVCLYLFERCATNYACLLRNAQFVRTLATNLHCRTCYAYFEKKFFNRFLNPPLLSTLSTL